MMHVELDLRYTVEGLQTNVEKAVSALVTKATTDESLQSSSHSSSLTSSFYKEARVVCGDGTVLTVAPIARSVFGF